MGVDYIVIGFDMEVQPLVTHSSLTFILCSRIWPEPYLHRSREHSLAIPTYTMSVIGIDVVSGHKLFEYRL